MRKLCVLALFFAVVSCKDEPIIPKPKAFFHLNYPSAIYSKISANLPFEFHKSQLAKFKHSQNLGHSRKGYTLDYKSLRATIYLTYTALEGNLEKQLIDLETANLQHAKMAQSVSKQAYENLKNKSFGMMYEMSGNVASPTQFFITDKKAHLLSGALYFDIKPNYDSIMPAVKYLNKDIVHLMESLKWRQHSN